MSNQIVITSGAKVRNLDGVLTGTAGIVGSVGFGTANGVATLDSSGKVPLSQLPASIITYLGTWNAATNTPTLANGTGDVGDLYICNVAGTVNFGAGPITFAVGDWVIYNGSEWQKSAGTNGTVTSVAMTVPTGLSVSGSPITTSGTLAVSLASGYTIPTTSFLSGLVPYTGATQTVDLGSYDLNARGIKINGTGGLGHADFKHQSGTPTGSASSSTLYADTNGDIAWLNDHSYTMTLIGSGNTANRSYTFPNASGTLALTSDISYPVTSVFGRTGAVTAQSGDYTTTQVTEGTNLYYTDARARGAISLTTTGTSGAATYNSSTGVFNIPNYGSALSGYVPYTGATAQVDLGSNNLYGKSLNVWGDGTNGGGLNLKQYTSQSFLPGYGYTAVYTDSSYGFGIWFLNGASTARQITFSASLLANGTGQIYNLPASNGTIALTSDIPSLANYVTTNTNQSITGIKTFTNEQLFGNGMTLTGGYITYTSGSYNLTLNTNLLTANRNVFLQDKAGTIALTSDLTGGTVTSVGLSSATSGVTIGSSPITTSGTITLAIATASGSQQGLLSSTDWTTFNNKQNALTNPVTGTGTSSYHAKFTGTSTIGNSMLTDDGTTLQSIGATRSNLYLKAASTSYYSQLAFTNGSSAAFGGLSYNNAGQYMQFETNSSEWMRLTSNGYLGIGTTGPSDVLDVQKNSNATTNFYFRNLDVTNTNSRAYLNVISGNVSFIAKVVNNDNCYLDTTNDLFFITGGSTKMTIKSGGNIGIGTTSPNRLLTVYNGSADPFISIYGGANNNGGLLFGSTSTGDAYGQIRYDNSVNAMYFTTNGGSERMRITSGGNVEIANGTLTTSAGSGTSYCARLQTIYSYPYVENYLDGVAGVSYQGRFHFRTNAGNGAFVTNIRIESSGAVFLPAYGNGTMSIVSGQISTSSDKNLKIDDGSIENALNKVLKLNPRYFYWNEESGIETNERQLGFYAQDVNEALGVEVANNNSNGKWGIYDRALIAMLTKAIQELKAEVDELKNK